MLLLSESLFGNDAAAATAASTTASFLYYLNRSYDISEIRHVIAAASAAARQ
jgi:hypothetical protein